MFMTLTDKYVERLISYSYGIYSDTPLGKELSCVTNKTNETILRCMSETFFIFVVPGDRQDIF